MRDVAELGFYIFAFAFSLANFVYQLHAAGVY